jgi:hypothetical protein
MPRPKLKVLCGGKMTKEERQAKLALLRSEAKDLDSLRNEFRRIKPGENYKLSEASIRALMKIRRDIERYMED